MLSGGQLDADPESNCLMAGEDAGSRKDASKKKKKRVTRRDYTPRVLKHLRGDLVGR